jgi:hypothetical protein
VTRLACLVLLGACGYTTPQAFGTDAEQPGDDDAPPDGDPNPVVGCPASYDVDLTSAGFSKYRVNPTALEWRQAQDACLADGVGFTGKTHLVVFADDLERLATEPAGLARNTWIGLTDRATEGTFIWVTVETDPQQSGPPMWGGANPDGGDDNDCVRISNAWEYDDKDCDTIEPSICECDANAADPARYP